MIVELFAPLENLPVYKDDPFWIMHNTEIVYLKAPTFVIRKYGSSDDISNY